MEKRGFAKGTYVPKYPVLFIPGLGYTGNYWKRSQTFKRLIQLGWESGGDLKVQWSDGELQILPATFQSSHIYSITFSNPELAVVQQGEELGRLVDCVKKANRSGKVILVGHSMGGLAAREYLQSSYYGNDVAAFVSVGTPHQGSNFQPDGIVTRSAPKVLKDAVWKVDIESDAVRDLRPKSIYLDGGNELESPDRYRSKDVNSNGRDRDLIVGLNDFTARPLPEDVWYASVIGGGCPFIATREQCKWSDGIVKVDSQDPNAIPGVNISSTLFYTDKDHFGEANDSAILIESLKPLLVPVE